MKRLLSGLGWIVNANKLSPDTHQQKMPDVRMGSEDTVNVTSPSSANIKTTTCSVSGGKDIFIYKLYLPIKVDSRTGHYGQNL
jgi:hypothetical protein